MDSFVNGRTFSQLLFGSFTCWSYAMLAAMDALFLVSGAGGVVSLAILAAAFGSAEWSRRLADAIRGGVSELLGVLTPAQC